MKVLLKAIITGFGLSVWAAIYKAAARRLGLEEPDKKEPEAVKQDGAIDPDLQTAPA